MSVETINLLKNLKLSILSKQSSYIANIYLKCYLRNMPLKLFDFFFEFRKTNNANSMVKKFNYNILKKFHFKNK